MHSKKPGASDKTHDECCDHDVEGAGGTNREPLPPGFHHHSFDDKVIRAKFVRNVYTIVTLQLLFTVGLISLFIFVEPVRKYVRRNVYLYFMFMMSFMITYMTLICCTGLRRMPPYNYILLSVFTLSMAAVAGTLSAYHNTYVVLMAGGITAAVCLFVTFFAIQTKIDVTGWTGIIFIMFFAFTVFGFVVIIVLIFVRSEILVTVYGGIAAFVLLVMLMYNTQLIVGQRNIQLSPEEYIYGALGLYINIINVFLAFLILFRRH